MVGRMATYRASGDVHEMVRKAEQGALPLFQAQSGFRAYSLAADGDEIFSLSIWDTHADAEAGNAAVAGWVRDNLADELELIDVRYAEVLLSTTLGISAAATARA